MPLRIGIGSDIHRLQPTAEVHQGAGRLMLAGVCVSTELSAVAHSDGDVVLHALVDAILGALGLGDIGERFDNADPRWKNADSSMFVEDAMRELRSRGGSIVNVDVSILAERPKLKSFKPQMRERLTQLVGCPNVNVKAGTNEGCDAVGRGEAISANVAALLQLPG